MIQEADTAHSILPKVLAPECVTCSPRKAMHMAERLQAPLFIESKIYADDRGWSLMNQLTGTLSEEGQINFSVQYPNVVKAWHRHSYQTDFWICVLGHLKAGIYRESDNQRWQLVLGEKRPGTLIIPPGLWHGATAIGGKEAGLLYYVSRAYNAHSPDEQRREAYSVPEFSWSPEDR